jgi:hypothetical protein|eukprot:COSAG02_NODE_1852_length_10661_cov_3.072429_2_plen_55_part_00
MAHCFPRRVFHAQACRLSQAQSNSFVCSLVRRVFFCHRTVTLISRVEEAGEDKT